MPDSRGDRYGRWVLSGLVGVVVVVAIVAPILPSPGGPLGRVPAIQARDETGALGGLFHPGVILALASNGSAALVGGIGVYTKHPELTLPVLGELTPAGDGVAVKNLTPLVDPYFYEGGVYAIGWNGTGWLLAGQAGWGGSNYGSVVSRDGVGFHNLTRLVAPYFAGGGIFALGWNGSAWLLGGNSSKGIALVSLEGRGVIDLSPILRGHDTTGWVQLLSWNGIQWLVGGQGVFGTLEGFRFSDLLSATPFSDSGAWAADWNGSTWVAGGGRGALAIIQEGVVRGSTLAHGLDQAALFVVHLPNGWLVGGKGTNTARGLAGVLLFWAGGGPAGVADLSAYIPASFDGGEIQGGAWSPAFGPDSFLLVGDGHYDNATGYGVGALALEKVLPA